MGIQELLVAGKRLERDQIRTLATTFASVKDELDHKDAHLTVATRANNELAQVCQAEQAGRLKALADKDEALSAVTANQRIYRAMENEAINMRFDQETRSNLVIESQMSELLDHQKQIAKLRAQLAQAEKNAEKQTAKVQAQLAIVEEERDSLKGQLKQATADAATAAATAAQQLAAEQQATRNTEHRLKKLNDESQAAAQLAAELLAQCKAAAVEAANRAAATEAKLASQLEASELEASGWKAADQQKKSQLADMTAKHDTLDRQVGSLPIARY